LNSLPRELSTIVLCYRAGESIQQVLVPLERLLQDAAIDYELVLVANYWPETGDTTPAIVRHFATTHERVKVVATEKQGGMGWDMRSGLVAASGAYLIVIDGDAQNPVQDVTEMYDLLRETGADLGKGRRKNRADSFYRRVISVVYNLLFRLLFQTWNLWDINGKPKGMTRDAYGRIRLRSDDWFIDAEMVLEAKRAGMKIVELPVIFLENPTRSSFVRIPAIWEFGRHMLRYRLRRQP
jgi:glycosyltransferase involved in cell wall biosynthesis